MVVGVSDVGKFDGGFTRILELYHLMGMRL